MPDREYGGGNHNSGYGSASGGSSSGGGKRNKDRDDRADGGNGGYNHVGGSTYVGGSSGGNGGGSYFSDIAKDYGSTRGSSSGGGHTVSGGPGGNTYTGHSVQNGFPRFGGRPELDTKKTIYDRIAQSDPATASAKFQDRLEQFQGPMNYMHQPSGGNDQPPGAPAQNGPSYFGDISSWGGGASQPGVAGGFGIQPFGENHARNANMSQRASSAPDFTGGPWSTPMIDQFEGSTGGEGGPETPPGPEPTSGEGGGMYDADMVDPSDMTPAQRISNSVGGFMKKATNGLDSLLGGYDRNLMQNTGQNPLYSGPSNLLGQSDRDTPYKFTLEERAVMATMTPEQKQKIINLMRTGKSFESARNHVMGLGKKPDNKAPPTPPSGPYPKTWNEPVYWPKYEQFDWAPTPQGLMG